MTITLNLIAFVFCSSSAIFSYKLFCKIKSRYFLPVVIALIYASILRLIILSVDLGFNCGITKSDVQIIFSFFYILLCGGVAGIYYGFKKFLNR
jgi:hypothetical protein